jgi:hypothetical protein
MVGVGRACMGNLEKREIALARTETLDYAARSVITEPTQFIVETNS